MKSNAKNLNGLLVWKLPGPLFITACLLLLALGVQAKIMVNRASVELDSTIEQLAQAQHPMSLARSFSAPSEPKP